MLELAVVTSMLLLGDVMSACISTTLKDIDPMTYKGIYCSPQVTSVQASDINANKFIGFYRKTRFENHICYYDKVKDDLVKFGNLTGWKMYTIG